MRVYLLHLDDEERDVEQYYRYLSSERMEGIIKLHNRKQRQVALGAGLLTSLAYGQRTKGSVVVRLSFQELCSKEMLQQMQVPIIVKGQHGKPCWVGEKIQFNLSHSGEFILLVTANVAVGCDIQKAVSKDYQGIARRFFGPQEIECADNMSEKRFFELWCAKESYGKLLGEGLQAVLGKNLCDQMNCQQMIIKTLWFDFCDETYYVAICKERESIDEENIILPEGL